MSAPTLHRLVGAARNYSWGSHSLIPDISGAPSSDEPIAEVWFGAHPGAQTQVPSLDQSLADLIAGDPERELGTDVMARFGVRLPYLMKLLAAAEPLSIQAHPTPSQAQVGCAAEDALGIPRDAPHRSFRDEHHKPELIVAVTQFEAMVGFRPVTTTLAFLDALAVDELGGLRELLANDGLGAALRHILQMPKPEAADLVEAMARRCSDPPLHWQLEADLLRRLHTKYPGDPGVLTALLLNRVLLEPGEGVYLGAGHLHAYVEGLGVEIMANSDNVLRGGLTPKHMDVEALLDVVIAEAMVPQILTTETSSAMYETPAPEFALSRYDAPIQVTRALRGPEVVLCLSGEVTVTSGAAALTVTAGDAVWCSAASGRTTIDGTGSVFVASVGG